MFWAWDIFASQLEMRPPFLKACAFLFGDVCGSGMKCGRLAVPWLNSVYTLVFVETKQNDTFLSPIKDG